MGKIKKGILGGFNGRVGNVIGASWKGIAYMRSEAQSIKNPNTQKQQDQRTVFGVCSDWVSKNLALFNVGFQEKAVKKSAFNAAVQRNLLVGTFAPSVGGGLTYDPEKCVFSYGSFPGSVSVSVATTDPTDLVVTFIVSSYDFSYENLVAYFILVDSKTIENPVLFSTGNFDLSFQSTVSLPKPTDTPGLVYKMFAFVCDTNTKKVCDSLYLGSYEIPE